MKRTNLIPTSILALLIAGLTSAEGDYVGVQECSACHQDIFAAWEKDAHSSVFSILEESEHEANVNCLPCHTTGFAAAEDGSVSYEEKNVTCESCHGPGAVHVKSPERKDSTDRGDREEVCVECHISDWSPAFDYEEYMQRGVH